MSFHVLIVLYIQMIMVLLILYIIQDPEHLPFYCLQVLIFLKIQIQMHKILIYHLNYISLDQVFQEEAPFSIFGQFQNFFLLDCLSNF